MLWNYEANYEARLRLRILSIASGTANGSDLSNAPQDAMRSKTVVTCWLQQKLTKRVCWKQACLQRSRQFSISQSLQMSCVLEAMPKFRASLSRQQGISYGCLCACRTCYCYILLVFQSFHLASWLTGGISSLERPVLQPLHWHRLVLRRKGCR